ncbi:hypothetical protein MAR_030478, partial [Mya arenaria]
MNRFSNSVTRTCERSTIGEGCSDDISGLDSQTCFCRTDYCNSAQNAYSSRVAGLLGGLYLVVYIEYGFPSDELLRMSADVSCYICGGCNDAFEVSKAQTASGCKSCKKFKEWGDYSSTIIRTCDLSTIGDGCSDEIAGIDSQTCYCRTDFCNSAQNIYGPEEAESDPEDAEGKTAEKSGVSCLRHQKRALLAYDTLHRRDRCEGLGVRRRLDKRGTCTDSWI